MNLPPNGLLDQRQSITRFIRALAAAYEYGGRDPRHWERLKEQWQKDLFWDIVNEFRDAQELRRGFWEDQDAA